MIPGGVNSPVRAFRCVGGTPYFVARAEGAYVWDVEGRRYIDYVQSYGAIILGHAHPAIVEAVREAAGRRHVATARRPSGEVLLAEAIVRAGAAVERCAWSRRGTEATMSAVRLARGFTGRDRVVKFAGCYHGHGDALLAEAGSGVATLGLPGSAGVTEAAVGRHRRGALQRRARARRATWPASSSSRSPPTWAWSPPAPGFLEGLRAECDRVGALLIFDEVITGFRLGPRRRPGALRRRARPHMLRQGHRRRPPRRRLRRPARRHGGSWPRSAPCTRPARCRGTRSPPPPAWPSSTSSTPAPTQQLDATAARLADGLRRGRRRAPASAVVPQVARWSACSSRRCAASTTTSAKRTDAERYARFFHALLDRGVALAPGAYEVLFPGLAHTDEVVDEVVAATADAAATL